jgi:hypothetical protein
VFDLPKLHVQLVSGGKVIGKSKLIPVDPTMGVATGYFEPTAVYDKSCHAFSIDGEGRKQPPDDVILATEDGLEIPTRAVAIHDFESLGEIEVHAFFRDAGQYGSLFPGAYEAEKAYWKSRG